jgi:hypothetical protein
MKSRLIKLLAVLYLLSLSVTAGRALAHHSFFAEFSSEFGVVEGEVVEVSYRNPHSHFLLKVINDNGEEELWDGHGQNVRVMMRSGWKKNSVKVGERLRIQGNLGLDGTKKIAIVQAYKEDGTLLEPFPGNTAGFVSAFSESQVKEDGEAESEEAGEAGDNTD